MRKAASFAALIEASEDLRINLVITHNDRHTGSSTLTVTQISRTDPDPSLFEIPGGYTAQVFNRNATES